MTKTEKKKANGDHGDRTEAGVAFMIRNSLLKYVLDIKPINDRLIILTLRGTVALNIFNGYFYTKTNEKMKILMRSSVNL